MRNAAWVSVSAISVFVTPLFFADIRWYRNEESVSPCAMSAVTVTMLRSRSEIYNFYIINSNPLFPASQEVNCEFFAPAGTAPCEDGGRVI